MKEWVACLCCDGDGWIIDTDDEGELFSVPCPECGCKRGEWVEIEETKGGA